MSAKKSQSPASPNPDKERFLVLLNDLRKLSEKAEMFCWFLENSSSGENCQYAQKALNSFFRPEHYLKVRMLVFDLVVLMEKLPVVEEPITNATKKITG